ncbi:J domain-containing protein [Marinobacter sp. 1Y8]
MTCWELLGISPTNNREEIEEAYTAQRKFVAEQDLAELDRARHDAFAEARLASQEPQSRVTTPISETQSAPVVEQESAARPLNARDQQVAREVVIQIEAMLHDSIRCQDPQIWRAILAEPPADSDPIREAIGGSLHPRIKPLLNAGELSQPVVAFLAQWFGWPELEAVNEQQIADSDVMAERDRDFSDNTPGAESTSGDKPQGGVSFWPAVLGWVVALVVLTSIFNHLTGS